jgi:hypothetical protein
MGFSLSNNPADRVSFDDGQVSFDLARIAFEALVINPIEQKSQIFFELTILSKNLSYLSLNSTRENC